MSPGFNILGKQEFIIRCMNLLHMICPHCVITCIAILLALQKLAIAEYNVLLI